MNAENNWISSVDLYEEIKDTISCYGHFIQKIKHNLEETKEYVIVEAGRRGIKTKGVYLIKPDCAERIKKEKERK
jgi:hypothetical protein